MSNAEDPQCPECGGDPLDNYYVGVYEYQEFMCSKCGKTYRIYNKEIDWDEQD